MARKSINDSDVLADLQARITSAGGKISFRALSDQLADAGKEAYIPYIRRFVGLKQLASSQEFETAESSRSTSMISLPAAPTPPTPAGGSK